MPPFHHRNGLPVVLGILSLAGLYAISRCNFLLFHCLAEAFSIVIAIAVFAIFWNTRQFLDNGVYLVIGFGCLFAGTLDLIYVFAYPGMSVFPGADGNIALQAKTVAQWYVSLSCVCAFPFLRRRINQNLALLVYSAVLALALGSIFCWRVFPDCFVEGVGQTGFERIGLVISCSAYLAALVLLVANRLEFDRYVFKLLAATLVALLVEDFASALAADINGFAKTVAHLCQVVALYFIYKAFVEVGLRKPYDLLFRRQQQSAEALERQQQFLEAVLDNAQSGIVACDANGVLTLFNRASQEVHGLPQKPLPAEQWAEHYDLYHPDGKTRMKTEEIPLFRALQGEHVRDVEMMVVPKAGPARTFVASGKPLLGKDGEKHGAVAAMHDITERKRAEDALRQSEEGLRLVLEASAVGWWSLDLVSGVLTADERCKALAGLPSTSEPSIALFLERIVPDDRPVAERHIAEARVRPGDYEGEYRTTGPDGILRWLFIKGRSFHDTPGKPFLKGIVMDVTDRKRAEESLRASEARYRLLVETIPQLAWRLSPDGLDVECNRRWYEYTGQSPTQVRAHGWLAAVHPDDLFRVVENAAHAVSTRKPYELEYRLRRASDASYRWHLSRALPVLGEDGQVTCWIGSNTDIEDLKQAQEILKQAHEEQLQRHRTELAHAARLSMMGEMAASLAHELNQPLQAVNNYAGGSLMRLLTSPHRDEQLVTALEQISEEANRAAGIVRRVRGFVQKREPQFSEVFVNNLVQEVVLFSKAELEQRRVKVVLELSESLPAVIGDPVQIEQVIMNLVRNGLEAMEETPEENRLLGIKAMRHGDEMAQVEVCDRGKGIGGEDLERVFEPFFTTKPEGMGMGLAISRSIVQAHGGRLWVTTNQDQGCTFHFTLPVGKRS
jgi:PAS domain S-box-containing protein